MKKLLLQWHKSTIQRYQLTSNVDNKIMGLFTNLQYQKHKQDQKIHLYKQIFVDNTKIMKHYNCCHSVHWMDIEKVCLHVNSKKLLIQIELYNTFYQALSCISAGQSPQQVKSKYSVAVYKVIKGNLIGVSSNLRNDRMFSFCYKWFFIAPSVNRSKALLKNKLVIQNKNNLTVGIDNIFIFELDRLNYDTFEHMSGLDITFCFKNNSIS